jgi:hypothetical protein
MQTSPRVISFTPPVGSVRGGPMQMYNPSSGYIDKGGPPGDDDGGGGGGNNMNQQCPGCHPIWYLGTAIGGVLLIATLFGGRS